MSEQPQTPAEALEYLDSLPSRIDQLPRSDPRSVRVLIHDAGHALSELKKNAEFGAEHSNGHQKVKERPAWLRRRR